MSDWRPIEVWPEEWKPADRREGMIVCIWDDEGYEAIEWTAPHKGKNGHRWFNLNSANYFRPSYAEQFTHWKHVPPPPYTEV